MQITWGGWPATIRLALRFGMPALKTLCGEPERLGLKSRESEEVQNKAEHRTPDRRRGFALQVEGWILRRGYLAFHAGADDFRGEDEFFLLKDFHYLIDPFVLAH